MYIGLCSVKAILVWSAAYMQSDLMLLRYASLGDASIELAYSPHIVCVGQLLLICTDYTDN